MKIGLVITNYNNTFHTKNAINSLNKIHNNSFQIVVVDNCSAKDQLSQLEEIEKLNSNVIVIYSKLNIGYFNGLNLGIQYLRNNYFEIKIIIIGNNDLLFSNDFYDSIIDNYDLFKIHPVISPSIVTVSGDRQNPHVLTSANFIHNKLLDLYYVNHGFAKLMYFISGILKRLFKKKNRPHIIIRNLFFKDMGLVIYLGQFFLISITNF